jgi:peptidoglycan/xylan/chitin deacetylase (PgdA/CDA1 family)
MNFNPNYHTINHVIKSFIGSFQGITHFNYTPDELLVLNLHSTPLWLLDEFRKIIRFLEKRFNIIHPDQLEEYYYGYPLASNKPKLLFTFDDGLKNNIHALNVLNEFGYRGLLFIVPEFAETPEHDQHNYYRNHIRSYINAKIDRLPEDVSALSPEILRNLVLEGHVVGSHSYTHTMMNNDHPDKQIREIIESKNKLESWIKKPVTHFCAPFNSARSVGKEQMQLIRSHYRFFHSTFPGSNGSAKSPHFIKRVNIETFWLMGAIKFACSTAEWHRWAGQRDLFSEQIDSQ